ncbi:MAG TPA: hypothetical protein VM261_03915 [Kofleriaceae bacterium]|nr:hypothetical protein [Kofleriaceae bacterium]
MRGGTSVAVRGSMKTSLRRGALRAASLLLALAAGCGDVATVETAESARVEDCQRARDHVVELRLAGTDALAEIEREKHRAVLVAALGTQFVDSCVATLSEEQIACLLAAGDSSDVNACNPAAGGN